MNSLQLLLVAVCAASAVAHADVQVSGAFNSGFENQAGLVFSPDGETAYWAAWNGAWGSRATSPRTIYSSNKSAAGWSDPVAMPFSGTFNDDDPYVSPDGRWLYFVSDRLRFEGDTNTNGDIWRYGLGDDGALERLDINTNAAEYSPVITTSGALYFASSRSGGVGQGDLYRSAPAGDGFAPAELLGPSVNSKTGEWNLWVAADESEILFEASSRRTNVSNSGDIYYSWRTSTGWTTAMPVANLNSNGSDLLPRLHPDGDTLYYTAAPIGGHARLVATAWQPLKRRLREEYAPTLLVANRSSHEITFIDLANGQISRRVATGEGPHLLSNVDNGRVLSTGFGEFPEPHAEPVSKRPPFKKVLNSRLTLVDVADGSIVLETRLEDCARPHASWIVGDRGFVTCQDEQVVLEIDLQSGKPVRRLDTHQEGSHVLSFDPRSRTMSVSNTDSGSVTLINIDSRETRIVELAGGSEGAAEIGGRFWVANAWHGSVSVVDPVTAKVVTQTKPLCNFPIALSADYRNRVWVACFGSAELVAIDRDSYELVARHKLDGQPLNILVHPARSIAYAALPRENAVAEIDLETGIILRKIPGGIEPDGLRWGR